MRDGFQQIVIGEATQHAQVKNRGADAAARES
jgi:hypothetical protein